MKPTEELVTEHKAVIVALDLLEKIVEAVDRKKEGSVDHLEQLLDFFRGFVDRCHHGKEEDVLFPELSRRGLPVEGGPIGVMLAEHEAGRANIRGMFDALSGLRKDDPAAPVALRENAMDYSRLLRSHIDKENNVLFPMADRLVPDREAEIQNAFDAIERDRVGAGKHEEYHALLHRLKEVYS